MNQIPISIAIILVILSIVLIILYVKKSRQRDEIDRVASDLRSQLEKAGQEAEREKADLKSRIEFLEAEIERLSPYRKVADADQKARALLASAKQLLEKARNEARLRYEKARAEGEALLERARQEAVALDSDTKQKVKALKSEAEAALDAATTEARKIIDGARERAEQIAGAAYTAMNNADLYERTAKAMKNIIEGYGDQYVIPGHSLLDDLAEEFGYTEAGVELKRARDRTKLMIRNGTAAICDYVEKYRKETAIRFVVDAFNGKVDSILSRVKHDNAGKLEQEIKDSFTLVNHNGKAFRDARITQEYLNARIDELKWAAVAQQLRLRDKEEQRRIKEQIREEEKARREFERAIREAAKEEEMLRKAMEKAQEQISKATAEQKEKYMKQLADLRERLKAAEEKNQRAMSMAQQTKRGHVYIISNIGSFGENVYKIGVTRRLEPLDRIRELGDSSVPFEFDVHAMIFSEDAPGLENQLHKHFLVMQMNKVNHRKEFFRVDLAHIREEVEKFGLNARWTMKAQAQEYYETLAIERAIKEDPAKKEAWINRQLLLEPVVAFENDAEESDTALQGKRVRAAVGA